VQANHLNTLQVKRVRVPHNKYPIGEADEADTAADDGLNDEVQNLMLTVMAGSELILHKEEKRKQNLHCK
jgi:hypothetical protein